MYNCTHVLYLQIFNTQNYILFLESQLSLYSQNIRKYYSSFASMYSVISCWVSHILGVLGQLVGRIAHEIPSSRPVALVSEEWTSHEMREVSLVTTSCVFFFFTIYIFFVFFCFSLQGMVVEVPFAPFFLSHVLGRQNTGLYSSIDELPSLDQSLYKSLCFIKVRHTCNELCSR